MKYYLDTSFDWKTDRIADVYDEMPFWTACFGRLLLNNFPISDYENVLDVGFGTGFPLIEIAQRLGQKTKVTGIDPWAAAGKRVKKKIAAFDLKNIEIFEADASEMPFADKQFDLIVSNLGVNNFEKPQSVLEECFRVLKPSKRICITSNLEGTFKAFFDIFEQTLLEMNLTKYLPALKAHIEHRGTESKMIDMAENAGFEIKKRITDTLEMRFLNGTAFLNHSFIILGFIDSWRSLFEKEDKLPFFEKFEDNLNLFAERHSELKLTVPMLYLEAEKRE